MALVRLWDAGLKRAARGWQKNTGRKKLPSALHRTGLSSYIFATKALVDNRKKNWLNSNISPICSHNMVNFGPLAAEILSIVSGTPANLNGFRRYCTAL